MAPCGPGYASPLAAMKSGPREKLLYCVCVQPNTEDGKTDLLATVDVDPESPTYCQIIHRLRTGNPKDELHHSGWNVCSSCYTPKECCDNPVRDKLILPALGSNRVYIVIEPSEMKKLNCSTPHTIHCLASGEIMISTMGDKDDNGKCDFVLIDAKTYKMKGTWIKGKNTPKFNYDFWYQPYHDIMVSSEWGAPKVFKTGFHPSHLTPETYGQHLNFFSWSKRELIQSIDLGREAMAPLEVRFLHNPKESQGYVGCAIGGYIYRFPRFPDYAILF
ncbi:unnamed protein product [Callosobruchus maculatus]|uniref:Selenium-binding protein 1 n=1 Tax=Callosobruchus maculatus TaxID=64391 RepID=A0A653CIC4_CALMS|nr:unnamed protein product [Callosobruchus maculatus]